MGLVDLGGSGKGSASVSMLLHVVSAHVQQSSVDRKFILLLIFMCFSMKLHCYADTLVMGYEI